MGRSLPNTSDGIIEEQKVTVNGQEWTVYAVGGSPAQAVLHGVLEVMHQRPALVVSGINYGENLGRDVTISGTVGAAMEAAALGIPALAISLQTAVHHHRGYSADVDFTAAAHFAREFGRLLLERKLPADVQVLKVDVPTDATSATPWKAARVANHSYFVPTAPKRSSWSEPGKPGYKEGTRLAEQAPDSDVFVVREQGLVAVVPISLDLTSRLDLKDFESMLR
jgi:5'-nucleotidase